MSGKDDISRRDFLRAGAGTSLLVGAGSAAGGELQQARPTMSAPDAQQLARDVGASAPPATPERAAERPGSDLMVEVLRDLGIEFVAANPASSFEGLQESIVNHGNPPNRMPELITALHEESAVDMAAGYARAQGRPMAAMLHGTVGTQHASMAIYQAYHSKTPMVLIVGRDDTFFRQEQTANDIAGLVRAFTKWDAQPETLEEALTALQEAWRQAMTPPRGPTVVVLDTDLQKTEAGNLQVPVFMPPSFPVAREQDIAAIASELLSASNPRIQVGRLRTPQGVSDAIELAELTGATVRTSATQGPMSFPQTHPLTGPGTSTEYDLVVGLETSGRDYALRGPDLRSIASERDLAKIDFGFIRTNPNIPPSRPPGPRPGRNDIVADAEASLPLLVAAVRNRLTAAKVTEIDRRTAANAAANERARLGALESALEARRKGWNGSPVSLARLYAELWPHIKNLDWCLSSPTVFSSRHHAQLWQHDKPYSYLGTHGAGGIGYCIGASVGAGLAARSRDRIVVNIQCDGDLNYTPGALWTAVHHHAPLLTIMHNNRGYHQEVMYLHYMAGVRGRDTDRMHIGTTLRDPYIDYAKMASAYGMESEGPIEDPNELDAAFARGVAAVRGGKPYLIDVITEPR